MTSSSSTSSSSSSSCTERFGDTVEGFIVSAFYRLGNQVGHRPRITIALAFLLTVLMGAGFATWETENRAEELWVPQDTIAEEETTQFQSYYPSTSRFNSMIVTASTKDGGNTNNDNNVLAKERLVEAMTMHTEIAAEEITVDGTTYILENICTKAGGACATPGINGFDGVCTCLITSILKMWNYDLETLVNDEDYMTTLQGYGTQEDFEAVLGNAKFDENGAVLSAEAFSLSYFIQDQAEVVDGSEVDEIGETWEKEVFLDVAASVPQNFPLISVDYFAFRSFGDEFGDAISGDLLLVQIAYVIAFLFLGANLGKVKCGTGSRWTMAFGALMTVGISTAAGFGLSSLFGLFFGPVHSLLPFILLGIGVDDAFVIVNAFDRERKGPRTSEDNEQLAKRCARSLARAGASITVTSATDLVAFGISSSSSLPALASFCAYAAISIFFLWLFSSTFFTATLVLDERRQRDNRRECLCCVTRKNPMEEEEDTGFQEDAVSTYFRKYHAPAILSKVGKVSVLTVFAGLFAFGLYGMLNLEVEDSERAFIPEESYVTDYIEAADEYYPSTGIDVYFVFQGSSEIYETRQLLANLDERLTGLSTSSPWISEPVSETAYQNGLYGLSVYLNTTGTGAIGGVALGADGWPTTEEDFVLTVKEYVSFSGPGALYAQDFSFGSNGTEIEAFRVQSEYVRLTKLTSNGEIIDDSDKQIEAMDDTRTLVNSWTDLPSPFPYSEKFITVEGFKIIKQELFSNVGMAIAAVGAIVFLTVASPMTAFLITVNVAFCIIEILGFMWALGIVIDSVSVINIVLAVGLSVDYSAHVGHSFMTKPGGDKNQRAIEALADIGAAVLNGAISTFLAVVVLLFSSSYVFEVLSKQFALTVALGVAHGLILLPVLLSLLGPKAFSSAGKEVDYEQDKIVKPSVEEVDAAAKKTVPVETDDEPKPPKRKSSKASKKSKSKSKLEDADDDAAAAGDEVEPKSPKRKSKKSKSKAKLGDVDDGGAAGEDVEPKSPKRKSKKSKSKAKAKLQDENDPATGDEEPAPKSPKRESASSKSKKRSSSKKQLPVEIEE